MTFTPGQRVGIVTGVQSVDGPRVTRYGTVVKALQTWNDTTEYLVRDEDTGEELVYLPFLLREVPTPTLPAVFVGTNVKALRDIGVPLTRVHDFAYGGVWTYITSNGIVFTTDRDGVILPDTTDNDDAVSERAATVERNDNF